MTEVPVDVAHPDIVLPNILLKNDKLSHTVAYLQSVSDITSTLSRHIISSTTAV
jgi:hypothetical protein